MPCRAGDVRGSPQKGERTLQELNAQHRKSHVQQTHAEFYKAAPELLGFEEPTSNQVIKVVLLHCPRTGTSKRSGDGCKINPF